MRFSSLPGAQGTASMRRPRRLLRAATAALGVAVFWNAGSGSANAQPQTPPRIWDVVLGSHVSELPAGEFVDVACGTNGGPPSAAIGRFENFARCPPEPSGLRELWFIYEDELEYAARALAPSLWGTPPGTPAAIAEDRVVERYRATQIMLHPVILSVLVDRDGRVQGYRIFTDPRSDPDLRLGASSVAITFKGRFGSAGWSCTDLPAADGEKPMGTPPHDVFLKERCEKISDNRRVTVESRQYYKAGQSYLDPATGKPTVNEFESRSSLEVVRLDMAAGDARPAVRQAEPPPVSPDGSARAAFLAGDSSGCPGCDLRGVSLKRRDLTGADLHGANLEGVSFHRAVLRGASLTGANLREANLNKAILIGADLRGADLAGALLYQVEAGRATFTGADLTEARLRRARLPFANLDGANLTAADLEDARLSEASFRNAKLNGANLYRAVLSRTNLQGVAAEGAMWAMTNLRGANLSGAALTGSDLLEADLAGADLTGADLGGTRLLGAVLLDSNQTGANFSGALMPDNATHP